MLLGIEIKVWLIALAVYAVSIVIAKVINKKTEVKNFTLLMAWGVGLVLYLIAGLAKLPHIDFIGFIIFVVITAVFNFKRIPGFQTAIEYIRKVRKKS